MKNRFFAFILALSMLYPMFAQQKKLHMYGIAFYNQENLFDTIHDVGKNDYDFLPNGSYKWNTTKYNAKLKNMARVLSEICTDKIPAGAAIIGMSEIENRGVVEDLLKQESLKNRGYKIVHYDGPDRRGIECAMLYNPKFFKLQSTRLVPYVYPNNDTTHVTRGFLIATGLIDGETVSVIVNHWPSRGTGSEAREWAGSQVRVLKDSLLKVYPNSKVIIMGDLNDDPNNKSVTDALGCKHKTNGVSNSDLYNPWWDMLYKVGQGTLLYDGKWNLFDQIVFTGNVLNGNRKSLTFYKNEIFLRDYLIQQEGKYKGSPKRTSAGGTWLNGYSDHLPTCIYLVKEVAQ